MRSLLDRPVELILQGLRSAGLEHATYMACPISSGYREVALMLALGVRSRSILRECYQEKWRSEVFDPNVADARAAARVIRSRTGRALIDPTYFETPGLTQDHYDALCVEVLECHASEIALAPGWQFSRGARLEVGRALANRMRFIDVNGREMSAAQVCKCIDDADRAVSSMGFALERSASPETDPVSTRN